MLRTQEFLPERRGGVVVDFEVAAGEEVWGQREPVGRVGAGFGGQVDGEAGGGEDEEGVQSFGEGSDPRSHSIDRCSRAWLTGRVSMDCCERGMVEINMRPVISSEFRSTEKKRHSVSPNPGCCLTGVRQGRVGVSHMWGGCPWVDQDERGSTTNGFMSAELKIKLMHSKWCRAGPTTLKSTLALGKDSSLNTAKALLLKHWKVFSRETRSMDRMPSESIVTQTMELLLGGPAWRIGWASWN